ncbi:Lrp/AsnC family transcriptional regulator [Cognatishimia sp. WU-CL00825]|uniref:Lrp/AsnC family transcriptional regulator n=1 Tax=Cognatishimia sp. WU-CL00825 TaxID=3127658 RepID=UPI0031050907
MTRKLDSKDRQILRVLQKDGRISNQKLADAVSLSATPCLRRLRLLEKSGVIRGFRADIDAKQYGLSLLAFISIKLESHTKTCVENFEHRIQSMDEVQACYLLTGTQDYLLHVLVADLDGYNGFVRNKLHTVGGIASIDSSISYDVVKSAPVYPAV